MPKHFDPRSYYHDYDFSFNLVWILNVYSIKGKTLDSPEKGVTFRIAIYNMLFRRCKWNVRPIDMTINIARIMHTVILVDPFDGLTITVTFLSLNENGVILKRTLPVLVQNKVFLPTFES